MLEIKVGRTALLLLTMLIALLLFQSRPGQKAEGVKRDRPKEYPPAPHTPSEWDMDNNPDAEEIIGAYNGEAVQRVRSAWDKN